MDPVKITDAYNLDCCKNNSKMPQWPITSVDQYVFNSIFFNMESVTKLHDLGFRVHTCCFRNIRKTLLDLTCFIEKKIIENRPEGSQRPVIKIQNLSDGEWLKGIIDRLYKKKFNK